MRRGGAGSRRETGPYAEEVAACLPGDDLVPGRCIVMDRAATLPAPPDQVWPWLVQLGKGRAGWYLPARVERLLPQRGRGLRRLDPQLQRVRVGDRVPDWGPGRPEFRAEVVDPPYALVWSSLRQRTRGHRWPPGDRGPSDWAADDLPDDVLALSWALVLRPELPARPPLPGTRLHLRLRLRSRSRLEPVWRVLGGTVDEFTVRLLFAGLRERVRPGGRPPGERASRRTWRRRRRVPRPPRSRPGSRWPSPRSPRP